MADYMPLFCSLISIMYDEPFGVHWHGAGWHRAGEALLLESACRLRVLASALVLPGLRLLVAAVVDIPNKARFTYE